MKSFTECTRVQMPALVHLTRLGYEYFGKISEETAGTVYDKDTNILLSVFREQFNKLNPGQEGKVEEVLRDIRNELDFDDLGGSFYSRLVSLSPVKLIDFENIENNKFHCTGEFTCKRDLDEFRPDITLFVNGIPLVIIEVKKPNNKGGMVAESDRMNDQRFPNKKFRRFINELQLMIFSNNMKYDTLGGIVPVQGAFYCTAAKNKAVFNCFREENPENLKVAPYNRDYNYRDIDPVIEKKILSDFNCHVIHNNPEYQTNKNENTPTNRIITSMCSPERLLYIIKYGIAYVRMEREVDGKIESINQKHIMRYQQLFASLAVQNKLKEGKTSGVIWHTQGSGKTALSYYLHKILTDYYSRLKEPKVAKFYFIVDRLDLLEQAAQEFEARGLVVNTANTRAELMKQFRDNHALVGSSGKAEITVVNIQRFAEDKEKVDLPAYSTNLQRVFIIDEAHRGYNPTGSFLANLLDADKNSIKIALTGTPLLKEERASWKIFGEYFHTYYYDKSIQDGYTLKIIREDIETKYKEKLNEIYEKLDKLVLKKDIKKADIFEHETYVKELLRYIITDMNHFRILHGDNTLGGMIICESSEQARRLFMYFNEIQEELNLSSEHKTNMKAGLILHDSDDKETRKQIIKDFKKNMTIDILIVYNMLLTGFDAPRLKRLYFGRKLKDHNLLQAITRVNRPYKDNRYGYVIDFADIKANFDETNEAYLMELNRFNDPDETGMEPDKSNVLIQVLEEPQEIIERLQSVRQTLFSYTTDNVEEFCSEVSTVEDKTELLELKKALVSARDCYNIVRTFGDDGLRATIEKLQIENLSNLITEVQHAIDNINQKDFFEHDDETRMMVNEAMMDIKFNFSKISEEEMKMISGGDDLKVVYNHVLQEFIEIYDQDDPHYISLMQAFRERMKEYGFKLDNIAQFYQRTKDLDEILDKLRTLKKKNKVLLNKYKGDPKFARVHKRIQEENKERLSRNEKPIVSTQDVELLDLLSQVKENVDKKVYDKNDILKKDAYFEQTVKSLVTETLDVNEFENDRNDRQFITSKIVKQYLDQYNSTYPAA